MGLFMSEEHHPEVFKSDKEIFERNQHQSRYDELSNMIQEERQVSQELQESVRSLRTAYTKQSNAQFRKLANARYHIENLYEGQKQQQESVGDTTTSVLQMDERIDALSTKIDAQMMMQKEIKEELFRQKSFQQEVIERLENQEALTEKVLRKVDHFRTILYERTHFISEKIGKGYEATAAYLTKMMKQEPAKEAVEEPKERKKIVS